MNQAAHNASMPHEGTAPEAAPGLWRKVIGNAYVRIVLGAVLLIALHPLVGFAWKFVVTNIAPLDAWLRDAPPLPGSKKPLPAYVIQTAAIVLLSLVVYRLFVRWTERRPLFELSAHGAASEVGFGMLTGFGLFSGVAGVLWLGGYYHVAGTNPGAVMLPVALISASAAVFEELLFRGLLFRILEQAHGSWVALTVSSLFFGLAHLANPNASLQAALAIAIEAGVLLGGAYMATRRLWLVMGLHFAWNFSESGIYGMPVSGFSMPGLLRGEVSGPALMTGGTFGAENSIVAIVLCLIVAWGFLRAARLHGRIVKRSRRTTAGAAEMSEGR